MARDSQHWMSIVSTVLKSPDRASKPYLLELLGDGYELIDAFRKWDDTMNKRNENLSAELHKERSVQKPEIEVGQKGWYLYDLFGEHLTQEMFITEFEMDKEGIKSIHTATADNHQRQVFSRNMNNLKRFTVDEQSAKNWKETK